MSLDTFQVFEDSGEPFEPFPQNPRAPCSPLLTPQLFSAAGAADARSAVFRTKLRHVEEGVPLFFSQVGARGGPAEER